VPKNAKSLALIMDDPDAPVGIFIHWVVWNIPPDTKEISKGEEPRGVQGMTSFRRQRYGGPCPPSGTHRYFFKLYALDTELNLPEGSTKHDLENAMQSHIIAQAPLMGTYTRS
jgi:Raf kinase inhibitor-like YbhB/YbcL family protein